MSIELKQNDGAVSFTLEAAATVAVEVSSPSSSNATTFNLLNAADEAQTGTKAGETAGATSFDLSGGGSAKTTITYTLGEGTYKMCTTASAAKGVRIYTITVTY